MLPIPTITSFIGAGAIDLVLAKLELIANVIIEGGREGTGDRGILGIVFGIFAKQIIAPAGKTRVETSRGQSAAALEFFHELRQVHAQIGLDEGIFTDPG